MGSLPPVRCPTNAPGVSSVEDPYLAGAVGPQVSRVTLWRKMKSAILENA
jgi:hypothetical protein